MWFWEREREIVGCISRDINSCWKATNSPNASPVLLTLVIHLQWSVYRWISERKVAPVSWSSLPHDRGHQQSVRPKQTILHKPDSQLLPYSVQRAEVEDTVMCNPLTNGKPTHQLRRLRHRSVYNLSNKACLEAESNLSESPLVHVLSPKSIND